MTRKIGNPTAFMVGIAALGGLIAFGALVIAWPYRFCSIVFYDPGCLLVLIPGAALFFAGVALLAKGVQGS